jgi:predicted permease
VALFSVVYGVVIAPFPYAHANNLWWPGLVEKNDPMGAIGRHLYTAAEFEELEKVPGFSSALALTTELDLLTGNGVDSQSLLGVRISGGAFTMLGVPPLLGRTIQPFDIHAGDDPAPVVVLSYPFWRRVFNGDPRVLGKQMILNNVPYTVVGVMPERFGYWTHDVFWLPMRMDTASKTPLFVCVRLAPGVGRKAAEEQLAQLDRNLAAITPAHFPKGPMHGLFTNLMDLNAAAFGMKPSLFLLLGAVVLLLMIACVNVANLQLARTTTRAREIAMRVAIGAGRGRLIRQLLTESVLLSLAGGALGVLFSLAAVRVIVAIIPPDNIPNEARIAVNGHVLLFAVAISMLTGILFGLAPALRSTRPDLVGVLKEGGSGAGGSMRGQAMRGGLVVTEIALSVILLTSASVAIRHFVQLMSTDPGFQPAKTLVLPISLPPERYTTLE